MEDRQGHPGLTDGMRSRLPIAAGLLFALILLVGCGGSGGQAETTAKPAKLYPWLKGPTREFLVRGGDNAVQTFGSEASPAERVAASDVVEAWMRARAARKWAADCGYLSRSAVKSAYEAAAFGGGREASGCASAVGAREADAPSSELAFNMKGPVASLRVGEGHAYAQYHGKEGRDWIVPLMKEDGEWKVTSLYPFDRMK
jgi:hypothetical protein